MTVPTLTPELRFLIIITVLALVTRLVWVLFVHPPEDYIFSDMKKYVVRAQFVAEHGFVPGDRTMAWQAWGTLNYAFNRHWTASAGYRYLAVDYRKDNHVFDVTMGGPMMAVSYKF